MIRTGDRRHRVTLQAATKARNASGEEIKTYTDIATVWAAIFPVSAKEYMSAGQLQAAVTHRVNIRFRADVKPDWRIKFGNRYFEIKAITNREERNISLDLICAEGVD